MQIELLHETALMELDRLHRHIQDGCHLFRAFPFGDQLEHLSLSWRQGAQRLSEGRLQRRLDEMIDRVR